MIETAFGMVNSSLDNLITEMRGQVIIKAEHLEGDSDADEKVRLTLSSGTVVTFGTSEWLHVEFGFEQGVQAKPTTAGA
jgi:hypothetical protein